MSLIPCPGCKREISPAADTCPHCGHPVGKERKSNQRLGCAVIAIGGFILLLVIGSLVDTPKKSSPSIAAFCAKANATDLVDQAQKIGIIYKIDAPRQVPRIYVTDAWFRMPLDQKKGLDLALHCKLGDGQSMTLLGYQDARTGKDVASSSEYGLSLK